MGASVPQKVTQLPSMLYQSVSFALLNRNWVEREVESLAPLLCVSLHRQALPGPSTGRQAGRKNWVPELSADSGQAARRWAEG